MLLPPLKTIVRLPLRAARAARRFGLAVVAARPRSSRLYQAARATRRLGETLAAFRQGLGVRVKPLGQVPCPMVDVAAAADPIPVILAAPEFKETVRWFAENPAAERSLVSPDTQALLFALVRNLKPAHVFEIGTFRCGSTEAICRALHANGIGTVHTVDPFGAGVVPAILLKWPNALRRHVHYHLLDSMAFYMRMATVGIVADLIFIDGNHEYEFALFDLQAAARRLAPGGFVLLDNVSQPGPFFAAADFMRGNSGWHECGRSLARYRASHPFDRDRTTIHNTDLLVLRAPPHIVIADRPRTTGQQLFGERRVAGMTLLISGRAPAGMLNVQCVLRGFGRTLVEVVGETSIALDEAAGTVTVHFPTAIALEGEFQHVTVEPWLAWDGAAALLLARPPVVF